MLSATREPAAAQPTGGVARCTQTSVQMSWGLHVRLWCPRDRCAGITLPAQLARYVRGMHHEIIVKQDKICVRTE